LSTNHQSFGLSAPANENLDGFQLGLSNELLLIATNERFDLASKVHIMDQVEQYIVPLGMNNYRI